MATVITTINDTDLISDGNEVINANFSSLNTNKIETSVIDTDSSLTANSDSKIATQKAVKTYIDIVGAVSPATTTTKGSVEIATDAQVDAGTAIGETGASLVLTPDNVNTAHNIPFVTPGTNGNLMQSDGTDWTSVTYIPVTYKSGVTTRDIGTASGTQTITHGLGKIPLRIKITGRVLYNSTNGYTLISDGVFDSSGNRCVYNPVGNGSYEVSASSSTYGIYFQRGGAPTDAAYGVISVDATNITITWTKQNNPNGIAVLMWEAE